MQNRFSRRDFAKVTAGVAGALLPIPGVKAAGPLTAREVMNRVREHLAIPWNEKTYRDVFHVGNPDGVVTGIASTFMANLDVFQRAHAAGLNFVISHEPVFWSDDDATAPLRDDAMYHTKRAFIEKNNMMEFRLHDHWHARKPDGISEGWNRQLGWNQYILPGDARLWEIPQMTLGDAAKYVAKQLNTRSIRLVGDPATPIKRVGRGGHGLSQNMAAIKIADAIIVNEAREADSIEYIRDVVASGQKKGLILISHEAGEEAGMDNFATWIKGFVTEVPIQFIATNDQMWIPA